MFAKSAASRYATERNRLAPKLASYVDDIFGGFPHNKSLGLALHFRRYLVSTGASLTFIFNPKPTKTPLPARKQVILGCLYDSVARRIRTAQEKREKYILRIRNILRKKEASVSEILQLHGNLNYAAGVSPFGRPFLSTLTAAIRGRKTSEVVPLPKTMASALRIWRSILFANRGVTFDFVLGNLPRCPDDIFVDASTEWGLGGVCGNQYFLFSWAQPSAFRAKDIPRKELLACLLSIHCFARQITGRVIKL